MSLWEALALGIVQGLTEFLPISSSGHLVLGKALLGITINNIVFEVFVHFGTLLAIVTVFRGDLVILMRGIRSLVLRRDEGHSNGEAGPATEGRKLLWFLLVGTLPAGIVGYLFEDAFEEVFSHPEFVCFALMVTGLVLVASRFAHETHLKFSGWKAFWVGCAQVAAIFPGISRSGTTISAAMLLGISRVESARFSFLLAIPLILAATVLQSFELFAQLPSAEELLVILIGTVAAYFSGLFAIKWLLAVVRHGRLDRFAYYCFAIGGTGLLVLYVF